MRRLLAILLCALVMQPAAADEARWLGKARVFNNDFLGDHKDRWRTGSYGLSFIRGTGWSGSLPDAPGELIEYRLRAEIIAPANLMRRKLKGDRPFVGATTLGAVTHFQRQAFQVSLGADLVVTGPQTGLSAFQGWVHNAFGMGVPRAYGSQIGNGVHPTFSGEIARPFKLARQGDRGVDFRPFVEVQAGVETYVRAGADFTLGTLRGGDMFVRDVTTGYRVRAITDSASKGTTLIVGGDVAYVQNSAYLPASTGLSLQVPRLRLRAGAIRDFGKASVFYGLTYLGKEFTTQPEGQVLGAVSVRVKF